MPDRTECPRCKKTGFVRYEHVIKGGRAERQYYCGRCNHSWTVAAEEDAGQNVRGGRDRSGGDR